MKFKQKPFLFTLVLLQVFLMGCMPGVLNNDGRQGLPTITDFSINQNDSTESGDCGDGDSRSFSDVFLDTELVKCLDECGDGFREATEEEIAVLLETLQKDSDLSEEEFTQTKDAIDASKGICVEEIIRPNNSINFKNNVCGCLDSKAITLNNCEGFCSSQPTSGEEILFVDVNLGELVSLNPALGSIQNWCSVEIGDGKLNPGCQAQFQSATGVVALPIKEFTGQTTLKIDIKSLPQDETFVLTIVETTSGSKTGSVQVRKIDPDKEETSRGPLSIHPVSQYTCIQRFGEVTSVSLSSLDFVRYHFYYSPNSPPPSIPNTTQNRIFCHDIFFGEIDSPLLPRLEEIPEHFAVWNYRDNRFVDTDKNGKEDINDAIQTRLLDEYSVNREVKIFSLLRWPNVINTTDEGSTTVPIVGYFMIPFINTTTGEGFCPKQENYNGNDPLFRVLKDYIGVDTEGVYLSERESLAVTNDSGIPEEARQDILIIRETLLKKIWFYYENNQHLEPDEITSTNKKIMFYWPPDISDPYVRKSTQEIYTVRSAEEIGTEEEQGNGLQTVIRPPDKRYGCVPSIGEIYQNPIIDD